MRLLCDILKTQTHKGIFGKYKVIIRYLFLYLLCNFTKKGYIMDNYLFSIFPNERFIDLNLYQCGWEKCNPAQSFGPHIRNHYLFHFIISGSGTLFTKNSKGEGLEYKIMPNQGFLLCPDQTNTYVADSNQPWEYVWLEFDGLRVKELVNLSGLSFDSPIYKSGSNELTADLLKEMLYIVNHSKDSIFQLIGHLYMALDNLSKSSINKVDIKPQRLADFYVHEAMTYIEQNFHHDITIQDIADFCNLNRSYFGKIFRRTIGSSPQEFLINYRMSKASELLKLTDLKIQDISIAVGYPNQLHFSRAFKNIFNESPRNWRNTHQLKKLTPK